MSTSNQFKNDLFKAGAWLAATAGIIALLWLDHYLDHALIKTGWQWVMSLSVFQ